MKKLLFLVLVLTCFSSAVLTSSNTTAKTVDVQEEHGPLRGWLTLAIAAYGAIVATTVLAWNIYVRQRDRGKIEPTLSVKRSESQPTEVWGHIVNSGRRPVTLMHWRVAEYINPWPKGGVTLRESERIDVRVVKLSREIPKGMNDLSEIKEFRVLDSTGKEWGLSREEQEKFERQEL